ncbi:MAG: hypothetical protein Q4E68_05830 [Prevotellaceae bacterium]|nr:hypothetical protein [Prevotellaceae bacterium]
MAVAARESTRCAEQKKKEMLRIAIENYFCVKKDLTILTQPLLNILDKQVSPTLNV